MNYNSAIVLPIILIGFLPGVISAQNTVRATPELQRNPSKSVSEARQLSFINTAFPLGLGLATAGLFEHHTVKKIGSSMVIYGLVVGPSIGNFYANDYLRGALGLATRVGSGILLTDFTREAFGSNVSDPLGWDSEGDVKFTDTRILVGSVLFAGSMVYSIWSSKSSVEEYNAQFNMAMTVQPVPSTVPDHGANSVPMLTATIHF